MLFSQIKLLLFFFIVGGVIVFRGRKIKRLYEVLFVSVGKDILSLCSRVVFLIIKKVLFIVGF